MDEDVVDVRRFNTWQLALIGVGVGVACIVGALAPVYIFSFLW
jgi:hypothetical protein